MSTDSNQFDCEFSEHLIIINQYNCTKIANGLSSCYKRTRLCIVSDAYKDVAARVSEMKSRKYFFTTLYVAPGIDWNNNELKRLISHCCTDDVSVRNEPRLTFEGHDAIFLATAADLMASAFCIGDALIYAPAAWMHNADLCKKKLLKKFSTRIGVLI